MTPRLSPARLFKFLILALWSFAVCSSAHAQSGRGVLIEAVPVHFHSQTPELQNFGMLEWRGGLEITSDDDAFGGYSGLIVSPNGFSLLAVSDKGQWLTATIVYDNGSLSNVETAQTAPVLGISGTPLTGKSAQDAEGLASYGSLGFVGDVYMALERQERILRFAFGTDGFASVPTLISLPDAATQGPANKELEAVGLLSRGAAGEEAILALSERHLDEDGNILGWIIGGSTPGELAVERSGDFDITDLVVLPDGDVLILERRLSALMLAGMRIRRLPRSDISAGRLIRGEVLLEADQPRATIDNMEAIAAHRSANGELRLTLMSDDNFNPLQRTLLLQFALPE